LQASEMKINPLYFLHVFYYPSWRYTHHTFISFDVFNLLSTWLIGIIFLLAW